MTDRSDDEPFNPASLRRLGYDEEEISSGFARAEQQYEQREEPEPLPNILSLYDHRRRIPVTKQRKERSIEDLLDEADQ